jgi:AcrR family transcriptional regulator
MPDQARARPGGRTARTRAAVLKATVTELATHGHDALTVERVALRAGVHKTTIYRRWGGKAGLLAEAVQAFAAAEAQLPDTGSVDEDLRHWAHSIMTTLTTRQSGAVVWALFRAPTDSSELRELRRRFYTTRVALMAPIVERAIQRHQLPAGTDPVEVIKQLGAPLYYRHLIIEEPLTAAAADLAAAAAVAAARAGVFIPDRHRHDRTRHR